MGVVIFKAVDCKAPLMLLLLLLLTTRTVSCRVGWVEGWSGGGWMEADAA